MAEAFQSPRGFHDILADDSRRFRRVSATIRRILESHGFEEIVLPVVEFADLFQRSIGENTDIVQKEMFIFKDRKGRILALRPEGTAGAVRAYIQHRLWTQRPYHRLFYEGPMFRYERPQAGRYRQFHQIGAEVFGSESPAADAELILMTEKMLKELSISAEIQINSIGCRKCRPLYRKALLEFLEGVSSNLCRDCIERKEKNPLRVLDCKVDSCQEAVANAPATVDFLCDECKDHYKILREYLRESKVKFVENPRLVRGLDYYTRTVFEAISKKQGTAVIAGGRYDYLVEELGGPPTPALGFAVGVERLMAELGKEGDQRHLYLVIPLGDALAYALRIAESLRKRGEAVEISLRRGGLKKQLEFADRIGASYAVMVGEDELRGGYYTLKDLKTGEQKRIEFGSSEDEG